MRALSLLKNALVPAERKPRRVKFGLYKDITLDLDLRSQTQMLFGLWERETYTFVAFASANARWLIDIGAGSGEMSLYFLRKGRPVDIIACEPQASEVEAFRHHLALNGFAPDACRILNDAIGNGGSAVSLADLVRPLQGPGFIKIDVDGAEMDVLDSAGDALDTRDVAMLIETHSAELEAACIGWLAARGFQTSIIDNAWWRRILPDGRVIAHNRWLAARRGTA
jgi:precorrin-6B methylase 2